MTDKIVIRNLGTSAYLFLRAIFPCIHFESAKTFRDEASTRLMFHYNVYLFSECVG